MLDKVCPCWMPYSIINANNWFYLTFITKWVILFICPLSLIMLKTILIISKTYIYIHLCWYSWYVQPDGRIIEWLGLEAIIIQVTSNKYCLPLKKKQHSVMSHLYIDSVFSLSSIFALIFLLSTMAKRETGNDTAHKRKPQLALVSNRKCALSGHF